MKTKKRAAELLFTLFLLGTLGAIAAISRMFPAESYSEYENRNLSEQPTLTAEGLLSGDYFTELESWLCDEAAGRTSILKLQTWLDWKVLRRPVVNEVVTTNDDLLLAYEEYEAVDETAITAQAAEMSERLAKIARQVEDYGGTFLYVMVPSQYAYFEDAYPSYLNNRSEYTRAELSALTAAMEERDVPYLDMGELWEAEGNPAAYMSTVDHHFTWTGAFDLYTHLMETLNEQGQSLRVLTEADVEESTLPNYYLGSRCRKLFGLWRGEEKLSYGKLKEEIPFVRYNWSGETPGTSTLWAMPESDWDSVAYTFYMGGDISETVLQTERSELPNGLIFGDSFTNAVETLYYASFNETRALDLRYYEEMSLSDYLAEYQPDVVVCLRDYEQLLSTEGNGNF